MKLKNDKYKKARGGASKLLDISCSHCGDHLCFYQKDGPGLLKRMYLDRISDSSYEDMQNLSLKDIPQLVCPNCKRLLGVPIIYEKEQRLALRLFVGAVTKKIVKKV
jgi:hypothetical protein